MVPTAQNLPLVDAARRGEPVAIEQLLRVCRPDVRRYAQYHCLVNQIDDAVQETLFILARKIHLLKTVTAFYAWVFTIVQRQCRRLGRLALNFDPYDEARVDAWFAVRSPDEVGIDLARAFDTLPEHYREVILLRDFAGLTVREIATRIGITTGATRSRLHRARELTREYLLT